MQVQNFTALSKQPKGQWLNPIRLHHVLSVARLPWNVKFAKV